MHRFQFQNNFLLLFISRWLINCQPNILLHKRTDVLDSVGFCFFFLALWDNVHALIHISFQAEAFQLHRILSVIILGADVKLALALAYTRSCNKFDLQFLLDVLLATSLPKLAAPIRVPNERVNLSFLFFNFCPCWKFNHWFGIIYELINWLSCGILVVW